MIAWWCASTAFWGAAAVLGALLAFDVYSSRRARPSSPISIKRRPITRRRRPLPAPSRSESDEPVEADLLTG
jgi:hypothetical protein